MKKLIFTVATILTATFGLKAQNQIGATIGLMQINAGDSESSNLIGLSVFTKHNLNDKLRIGVNLGYYSKSEDDISLFSMPITGLIEYKHKMDKLYPFGGIEVGLNRFGLSDGEHTYATINLALAPVIGVDYELNKQFNAVLNAKYNYIMTENNATTGLGFNIGVTYKL